MISTEIRPQNNPRLLAFLKPEPSKNLDAFIGFLREAGYPVNVLERNELNFEELNLLNPAAILFDCVSAAATGLELLKQLKEKGTPHKVPVFFISDQDDETLAGTALKLGADEWISFPVREKETLFRIKNFLARSPRVESTPEKMTNPEEARLESLLAINEYQADSIQDLLDFALNEIIILTESKIGYVYFYSEEKREFTLNTWSGEVMDECKVLEPQTTYQLDDTGIWGEVVRQRKPIVVNDFQAPHALKKGYPEGHIGLTRFLSIPVFDNNLIVAVVGVGNKTTEYNQADIRQLSLMMNSVWAIVRKKEQERLLAESEKRFRIMYESAPLSYQSLDRNACLVDVNQKWLDTLGYTRDEVIGRPFGAFMTPESAELIKNRFAHFLEAGEIHDYLFDMVRKDGTIITVSYDGNIGYDEQGNFKQTHCIFSDISEKKKTELALRESEERFRTTLYGIGDGVITTDARGTVRIMNAIAEQLTGWSQTEAEGKMLEDVFRIINEDTRQPVEIPVRTVLRDGAVVGLANHTVLVARDGSECPIADSAAPIRNENGEIAGVVLVFRDQTEERRAQNALRASENRFRRMVESSPMGKYLYRLNENNQLVFIQANPSADRIIGIDHRQLEGKTIQEAFPDLAATEIPELYIRIAKGELDNQRFEIKYTENQIDGYFEVTVFRIGENTIAVDFVDISERKTAQQKLVESEEKYRYLFENNPQPMWIYDLETLAFLNVNEAATLKYGFSREEFLSMTLKDIRPAAEHDRLLADVSATTNSYNDAGIWKHRKKNGELIDVEIISHQINYEGRNARLVLSNDVTQRVRAEQDLRESEERFRTTLYSIGDGVITTDATGNVLMMNDIAVQLTGWSQADAVGKLLEDVFPIVNEETRKAVEIPVRRVLREGIVVGLANHTMLIAKDGTERPIADSAAPIRNEQGEITGVVLVFRDQTDEREAERRLQESEFFFRESQRAATIGSYNFSVTTGIWTSSEVLDQIFGIGKDYPRDVDGWETLIYPDDLSMMDHHLKAEVIGQKKTFNKEYRIIRKSDGAIRWVQGLGQLILDKNGKPVSMIGTIQDITERKKAEEEIRDQNNRLNAIIHAMPDLIFISDREGNYLEFFNPKSTGMLYAPDRLIGANVRDVFDQATAELHLQKIQECLDSKKFVGYEYSGGQNGTTAYFEGRMVPLDENRVLRFVRDITESKKLEQEQFRLLNIIDNSLNEIYVFDSETLKFSYVNQGALKNLGYSLGEMKELTPVDIKPQFDWNSFVKSIEPLISGQKQKLVFETVHQRKNGTTYPVDVHLQLHRQGEKSVFFAVINDITSRKLTEALVHESEEMFRKLAESTPIAICIYQDEKWIYTNPAGERLSGYTLKEYQEMFIWDFVAPEYQAMIKEYARTRIGGSGSEKGYEFRIIRKNGESRWVYLKGSRINYKGRPAGLISVLDMTEKKKMEDELRQSEQRFRKAITEAPFPIMLHVENGEVIELSRGWTEMSGYDLRDVPTTTAWAQKAYGSKQAPEKPDTDELTSLAYCVEEGRYTITTKSGEQRIWDFSFAPLGQQADGQKIVISMAKDMTDHLHASEIIQNERTLLRTVIDNLPDPIYVKDIKGRKILANKADLENIGAKSEAEVIGKTDFELFDFETAQKTFEDDLDVIKYGRQIINREEVFHLAEGNPRWLLTTKVPLTDQTGKIVGLVGIGRDITGQKKAGETIQKLSKSIEQSPSNIIITDIQGRIEYVNPRFSEVTGYQPGEVIGKMPQILKPGNMSPDQFDTLWKTVSSGEIWRGEFTNEKKNKIKFTESVVISPVLDEQKKVVNLLIISDDITSKKKEEKVRNMIHAIIQDESASGNLEDFIGKVKLRLGELIDVTNFYLALYDQAKDMFWLPLYKDQRDDIETFDAAKTLTAYVLRSGKPFLGTQDEINRLKDAGLVESIGDPAKVWLGVPLIVGDTPMGVFAVQSYEDTMAFNEQDQQLLELVAHEISFILLRIKSNEEVKRALERAEESDRLKSAFLANMSHEIRTPLNSIIGFSELLKDENFDAEQKDEFIHYIIENGNQLLNIISDILDISKIESGEIVIRKAEIPVKRLVNEVRALHILKVESKSLEFKLSCPETLQEAAILADRERVHQIFNNLISNALKFTSEGYIQVGCAVAGHMLMFYVKDTGIGISPNYHAQIFDRFRQVETFLTRKFGGNGLGLTITKNLVELMGGTIWLESEPGKGSTFFFTVPLAHQKSDNELFK